MKKTILIMTICCFLYSVANVGASGFITYSFDDGDTNTYNVAYPILAAHGQIGTVNPVLNRVLSGTYSSMNVQQLLDLQAAGWEICSHSVIHVNMEYLPLTYEDETSESSNSAERELEMSKIGFNDLGLNVQNFVVPGSRWNNDLAAIAARYYNSAATGGESANTLPLANRWAIKRRCIGSNYSISDIIAWINNAVNNDEWLILMFHNICESETCGYAPWAESKLDALATWVENQGITVVTQQQGLELSNTPISAPDVTPPIVSSNSPLNNATNIPTDTTLSVIFSEEIDPSTIDSNTFIVNNGVTGTISYDVGTITATFTPATNLSYSTTYTATITTGVEDLALNPLQADFSWSFTTASAPDTTPPAIEYTNPINDSVDVPVNSSIFVTFSEDIDPSTLDDSSMSLNNGVSGTVNYDPSTKVATFTPSNNLSFETNYTVTLTTDILDLAGNPLQEAFSWSFTTASAPDNTAPEVEDTSPSDNSNEIPLNSAVFVTFSKDMDAATINSDSFYLNDYILGSVSYDSDSKTATFTPSDSLAAGTLYTATINTDVKDVLGNAITSEYSWSFTTISDTDTSNSENENDSDSDSGGSGSCFINTMMK